MRTPSYNKKTPTVHLRARANAEGRLVLDLPDSMRNADFEVTVVAQTTEVPRDEMGWPIGFREKYFGAFPDAPEDIEELPLNEPNF